MSDIDEDFMCDDEEDYGLVRIPSECNLLMALFGSRIIANFALHWNQYRLILFVLCFRNIPRKVTQSQTWTWRINITIVRH